MTSDLSGLGNYIQAQHPDCSRKGLFVVRRKHVADEQAAAERAGHLLEFSRLDLRDRITLRFRAQELAEQCDWKRLIVHYHTAHADAVRRLAAAP